MYLKAAAQLGRLQESFHGLARQDAISLPVLETACGLFNNEKQYGRVRDLVEEWLLQQDPSDVLVCHYINALLGLEDADYAREFLAYCDMQDPAKRLALLKKIAEPRNDTGYIVARPVGQSVSAEIPVVDETDHQVDVDTGHSSSLPLDRGDEQAQTSDPDIPATASGPASSARLQPPPLPLVIFVGSLLFYGGMRGQRGRVGQMIRFLENKLLATLRMGMTVD
ncbi:hypothetical protein HDV03_000670 [Kappamyces sp. JEL0829]|nr:hypothetical protein HDV03_000670 [Kappamyces sp. JEL0829]